jgi:hypothetical protein
MGVSSGLVITAGMIAATPINPVRWLTWDDYPREAKILANGGAINASIMVSPQGKPIRCEVKHSTDSSKMGMILCSVLMSKAKFEPARNMRGEPTYMAYNMGVTFQRALDYRSKQGPAPLQIVTPVDIALDVAHLPDGMKQKIIRIVAQTDESGNIIECIPSTPDPASAKFEAVACAQAKALVADPALDENGKPVTALRSWTVVFRTAAK